MQKGRQQVCRCAEGKAARRSGRSGRSECGVVACTATPSGKVTRSGPPCFCESGAPAASEWRRVPCTSSDISIGSVVAPSSASKTPLTPSGGVAVAVAVVVVTRVWEREGQADRAARARGQGVALPAERHRCALA